MPTQMSKRADLKDYETARLERAEDAEYWFARRVASSGGHKLDGSWESGDVFDGREPIEVKTVDEDYWQYVNCGSRQHQKPHLRIVVIICLPTFRIWGWVHHGLAVWGRPVVNGVVWNWCWYVLTEWIQPYTPPEPPLGLPASTWSDPL